MHFVDSFMDLFFKQLNLQWVLRATNFKFVIFKVKFQTFAIASIDNIKELFEFTSVLS